MFLALVNQQSYNLFILCSILYVWLYKLNLITIELLKYNWTLLRKAPAKISLSLNTAMWPDPIYSPILLEVAYTLAKFSFVVIVKVLPKSSLSLIPITSSQLFIPTSTNSILSKSNAFMLVTSTSIELLSGRFGSLTVLSIFIPTIILLINTCLSL